MSDHISHEPRASSPPKAPTRPPPPTPLSSPATTDIGISMSALRSHIHIDEIPAQNPINQPELDNGRPENGKEIHFSGRSWAGPVEARPLDHYLVASPPPQPLTRKPRIRTMRPSRPLPHSTTSPSILPSPSGPLPHTPQKSLDRDGAISRLDRYSKIITPPPPTIAGPSRSSGLRTTTFASSMQKIGEKSETPPPHSSIDSSSRKPRFPHHFGLASARQGMQKALASMRPTPTITGLSLRKKPSTSKLAPTPNRATTPHRMEIGAPTGVVKKTPEELQRMLREMGYAGADLPSHNSSSSSKGRVGAAAAGREIEDLAGSEKKGVKRVVGSESMASISTETSSHVPAIPAVKPAATPQLSAKQLGKLPAREESSSSIATVASRKSTLIPNIEKKPVGWYATATLDEIRATLPKIEKKDLIPDEEVPEFLAGLLRDFEMLKSVSAWRSEQVEREVEDLVEAHLAKMCGDKEVVVGETGDDDDVDDEDEDLHVDEDGNVNYTWGEFGEPDPRFVDCGWGQVDISSRGVDKCWFVFGDVEDVLGGPKCPLTYGGFEEDQEDRESVGVAEESTHETEKAQEADHAQDQQSTRTTIHEDKNEDDDKDRFADADEDYDEDARNLTQAEILLREGML